MRRQSDGIPASEIKKALSAEIPKNPDVDLMNFDKNARHSNVKEHQHLANFRPINVALIERHDSN